MLRASLMVFKKLGAHCIMGCERQCQSWHCNLAAVWLRLCLDTQCPELPQVQQMGSRTSLAVADVAVAPFADLSWLLLHSLVSCPCSGLQITGLNSGAKNATRHGVSRGFACHNRLLFCPYFFLLQELLSCALQAQNKSESIILTTTTQQMTSQNRVLLRQAVEQPPFPLHMPAKHFASLAISALFCANTNF